MADEIGVNLENATGKGNGNTATVEKPPETNKSVKTETKKESADLMERIDQEAFIRDFESLFPDLIEKADAYDHCRLNANFNDEFHEAEDDSRTAARKVARLLRFYDSPHSNGRLAKNINNFNQEKAKTLFEALRVTASNEDVEDVCFSINFLYQHKAELEKLDQRLKSEGEVGIDGKITDFKNFIRSEKFTIALGKALDKLGPHGVIKGQNFDAIENVWGSSPNLKSLFLNNVKEILNKHGLKGEEVLHLWIKSTEGGTIKSLFKPAGLNLEKIIDVERKSPGTAKFLNENFGINCFGRYPTEMLINQVKEYGDKDSAYGLILLADNDHNNAFMQDVKFWKSLNDQVKDRYLIRVAEAGSKYEIARRLISLDKLYGEKQKISFAFIGGHGTKDSIEFSNTFERGYLFTKDLSEKGVRKAGKFFKENTSIVLISCSTGAEGGIGQKLSKTFRNKVIAPEIPTNPRNVKVNIDGDKINFEMNYSDEGISRAYEVGIKAEDLQKDKEEIAKVREELAHASE